MLRSKKRKKISVSKYFFLLFLLAPLFQKAQHTDILFFKKSSALFSLDNNITTISNDLIHLNLREVHVRKEPIQNFILFVVDEDVHLQSKIRVFSQKLSFRKYPHDHFKVIVFCCNVDHIDMQFTEAFAVDELENRQSAFFCSFFLVIEDLLNPYDDIRALQPKSFKEVFKHFWFVAKDGPSKVKVEIICCIVEPLLHAFFENPGIDFFLIVLQTKPYPRQNVDCIQDIFFFQRLKVSSDDAALSFPFLNGCINESC